LALLSAENLQFDQFLASSGWLSRFKKRHRIVGRKVTKLVGHRAHVEIAEKEASIHKFLGEMKPLFKEVPAARIFNADQTGVNLEMMEGRTLETKGAKAVEAKVQRINATTHSYSIQPLISAGGVLIELTLLNQVMHQFAAPRFRDFVRYSFFRSGYTNERPPAFDTPPQYCLNSYPAGSRCEEKECMDRTILRCAYCERCLCFKHFLLEMHN
jgi:hypothetical protein